MSEPITIFLCGKFPTHIQACKDVVKPEFEVIDTASSMPDILERLPPLLNANKLRGVSMGGGFSNEDLETILSQIPKARDIPWFRPHFTRPGYDGPKPIAPPTAEQVSTNLRKELDRHAGELREGKGSGEIWYF